jgi:hypothetical protein
MEIESSMTEPPENQDEQLSSPAALKLGEVHWYILKAANLMNNKTTLTSKSEGWVVATETTEFGREVGRDEINWWFYRKESNVEGLLEHTERALDAVQNLRKASESLKESHPVTYAQLLKSLDEFAEAHITEIQTLYDYVTWLASRDVLAPTILYTYRVWGTTRMGERWIDIEGERLEEESQGTILHCAEKVLGLSASSITPLIEAQFEVGEEIRNSIESRYDYENVPEQIDIPIERVVRRAARKIYDNCSTYFLCVRDSLRNILLDIGKLKEERNLLHSDRFWRDFVVKATKTKKVEPQLWDFKETLTIWRVTKDEERKRAKVTFAEDIASLANARGGVLITGFTDQREIIGIGGDSRQIETRLKTASDVIARHVEYDRPIVSLRQVDLPGTDGVDRNCLLVIVAQACGVVAVNDGDKHYTYPVRRETGIERVSQRELLMPKFHMKSDNHDFLKELMQFVMEN